MFLKKFNMQNLNNVNLHAHSHTLVIYPTYKCKIGFFKHISKVYKADIIHLSNGCQCDRSYYSPEGLPEGNCSSLIKELSHSKPMDKCFYFTHGNKFYCPFIKFSMYLSHKQLLLIFKYSAEFNFIGEN